MTEEHERKEGLCMRINEYAQLYACSSSGQRKLESRTAGLRFDSVGRCAGRPSLP